MAMFIGRNGAMDYTTYLTPANPGYLWWLALLRGISLLIIGALLFTATGVTLFMLVTLLGVYWLIGGIFDLVEMFLDRTQWGWRLLTGVIGIVAGLAIVRHPLWAAIMVPTTLAWLLGAFRIAIGVITLMRAAGGAGSSAAITGAINLLLGVILLLSPRFSALVLVVYAAATWAIVGGVASIVWAFRLRSLGRRGTQRHRLTLVRPAQTEK